jgi:Ca2+-binding RTX toxin-like protein
VYSWSLGDGSDRISDRISDNQGGNRLEFGTGVSWGMVQVAAQGLDLVLKVGDSGERIYVADWFKDEANQLGEIRFLDGTVWTREEINAKVSLVTGTDSDDVLQGAANNDLILGQGGKDTLYGQGGDDSLVGGHGDDVLSGGAGDDVYLWNPGDGNDTIVDSAGSDVLEIGDGIASTDVTVYREASDLVFELNDGSVRVQNWYLGSRYQVDVIQFADGTEWTATELSVTAQQRPAPVAPTSFDITSAAALLSGSGSPFVMDLGAWASSFDKPSEPSTPIEAELNITFEHGVVEVAVAMLQMQQAESAMVCATQQSQEMGAGSVLAVSGLSASDTSAHLTPKAFNA